MVIPRVALLFQSVQKLCSWLCSGWCVRAVRSNKDYPILPGAIRLFRSVPVVFGKGFCDDDDVCELTNRDGRAWPEVLDCCS